MKGVGDLLSSGLGLPPKRLGNGAGQPGSDGDSPVAGDDGRCPQCRGKGFLALDVPQGDPNFGKIVPCRCTEARRAAARAEALRAVSNLSHLSRMTFDNFMPDGVGLPPALRYNLRIACELSMNFARQPEGWLVLRGGYGCGKTHLAAAIANQRISLGFPVIFVVVPDLLDHLRATYAPTSPVTYDERLEEIRDAPLLILDDLGSHNSTPWAQEKLFQILNHRYSSRFSTVITTNQGLEDLDARICSRLVDPDVSQVYTILAPDFRGNQALTGTPSLSSLTLHGDQTFETFSMRANETSLSPEERENLRRALAQAKAYAEKPKGWLVLTGTFGCGKTHLAAAIANQQMNSQRADASLPMFVVVPDLLDHLRATFSPNSSITLDKLFEQVRSSSLLILDDLGTESATPWAKEKLFQLLNHRYVARLPTVVTTASPIDEVEPRLRSRMLDGSHCTVFALQVPSYRGGESQTPKKRLPTRGKDSR